jgi:acyl-CoA synthetase (AMP-forming)/AMP-acid ligase II
MKTIPAILRDVAGAWPDRSAIIQTHRGRDRAVSFSQLKAASDRFSRQLSESGLGHGDVVLVLIPMSIELYVALLGVFGVGAVAMFPDLSAGLRGIDVCCRISPPAAMAGVLKARFLRPFVAGLRRIPRCFPCPLIRGDDEFATGETKPDDPALITFTSGSTGQPKAAVRTHRFLVAQHETLKDSIRLEAGELDLTTLPVFVLANLASGVTSLLPDADMARPGFVDAVRLARQIERHRPIRTGASPAFLERLADHSETRGNILSGFHKIYTGGAPVFPGLLRRLQTLAPQARVEAVYGSTEAEPIAHIAVEDISEADWKSMADGKGLLAGNPVPQIRLRILPDQWGGQVTVSDCLPANQPGEIVVTGDHVLKGYLNGTGDNETKFSISGEIWHRTGDAGYFDDAGRVWLLGRCSARVGDDGLYPFAVECVAMSFPKVRRAAFALAGEKRILALEPHGQFPDTEFGRLRESLAWAKIDEIRIVRQIPMDRRHNAKVDYPKLKELLDVRAR